MKLLQLRPGPDLTGGGVQRPVAAVDSCAYLTGWLDNLRESPQYLKTVLADVKKASAVLTRHMTKLIGKE